MCDVERPLDAQVGANRVVVEVAQRLFQVEGDGGQALGQRVVDLAGQVRPLLRSCQPRAGFGEPGPIDGNAEVGGNDGEQAQLLGCQLPPGGGRNVHDAKRLVLEIEGDAGVVAQACRRLGQRGAQAAALQYFHVGGGELFLVHWPHARASAARALRFSSTSASRRRLQLTASASSNRADVSAGRPATSAR